ncbi:hypothetical protein EI94DRAFT_1702138 [Lactarius quietus]|nr:hypothetical protein EI94DRAFT_1702138 [Lactarius quietus]
MLLDDPARMLVTLTLSLLKCLQMTQESDFNSQYGIPMVVINEDTLREDAWWAENVWDKRKHSPGHAWLIIVTVKLFFKSCEGHFPHLALLICDLQFQKHITCVIVNKAYNIHTAGLPHYGLDAFCPAWGRLDELKAIIPQNPTIKKKSCNLAMFPYMSPQTVRTPCQCVGVDFPNVKIVCTAGLPSMMVNEVALDEYNEGDLVDPDRPRAIGGDGSHFTLEDILPGKLSVTPPPSDTMSKPKRTNNIYCPTQEHPLLEFILWLKAKYLADLYRCTHPPDVILTDTQCTTLVHADLKKLNPSGDITTLLEELEDWDSEWAAKIFNVISNFTQEYKCIAEVSTTQQKRKCK